MLRALASGCLLLTLAACTQAAPHAETPAAKTGIQELDQLSINEPTKHAGYSRDQFGQRWRDVDHNGCGQRNDVLNRDLTDIQRQGRCIVVGGTLDDPYTGGLIKFSKANASAVQIDHIYPLSLAWQMGAYNWDKGKREFFANDLDNLLAVDGPTNMSKGDSGPAEWEPKQIKFHCGYAQRYIKVATKYRLPVSAKDKTALAEMLRTCK